MSGFCINIVEFGHSGHQKQHLFNLINGFRKFGRPNTRLQVILPSAFFRAHPETKDWAEGAHSQRIAFDVLDADPESQKSDASHPERIPMSWIYPPGPPPNASPHIRWSAIQNSATKCRADKLFLPHIDGELVSLAGRLHSICDIYGLLHAPPVAEGEQSSSRRLWALHQKAIVSRALNHPRLRCLFAFDDAIASAFPAAFEAEKLAVVPDPVELPAAITDRQRNAIRARLGVRGDAIALLFFGRLSKRKGLAETISAILRVVPDLRHRLALLVAGSTDDVDASSLLSEFDALRRGGVHVWSNLKYVPDAEATELYWASDVVLVPYIHHVGISGVMLRAAAHLRPVLSQEYGLMGRLVRRHRLGMTVDPQNIEEFSQCIEMVANGAMRDHFDAEQAKALSLIHNAEDYQRIIFERLASDPS